MQKIDLRKEFENARLVNDQIPGIALSFDSLRQSHLFALAIYQKGGEKQLWALGPSDNFFDQNPMDDYRFDSVLSMDEKLKDGRLVARVDTRFNEAFSADRNNAYSALVREVIKENIPHLAKDVEDFKFK